MIGKKSEKEIMDEFLEFVEADPVSTKKSIDNSINEMVRSGLFPSVWIVLAKFFSIETLAGISTLLVCPQFGFGFSAHNQLLHSLHVTLSPFFFYVACGIFFLLFGAALAGLILSHDELRAIKKFKYTYYIGFSLVSYMTLIFFGSEVFMINSIAWILGATVGNFVGFESVIHLRSTYAKSY